MSVPCGAAGTLRRSLRRHHVPPVRGHPGALPPRGLRRRRPLRTDHTRHQPGHRVRLHRRRRRLCGLRRRQPSQRGKQLILTPSTCSHDWAAQCSSTRVTIVGKQVQIFSPGLIHFV